MDREKFNGIVPMWTHSNFYQLNMTDFQNEELLDAARDIAKIFNTVWARSNSSCRAETVQEALQVARKVQVKGIEVPKNFSAATYLDYYTPEVFSNLLRLTSVGLLLTEVANRALLTLKFRRYGTVAPRIAKIVQHEYTFARSAGVSGVEDLRTVSEIIDWLTVGHTYKRGHYKERAQIKPIPPEFRTDVEACLRLSKHLDLMYSDGGVNLDLPERFSDIDVVLTPRKEVARRLSCKLPEWFEIKIDWLDFWRNQVEGCAGGIVDMFNYALQAGNQEILSATDIPKVLRILIDGAAGTGDASNVSYSIDPPNREMRDALIKCLKIESQTLIFDEKMLPTSLPPSLQKRPQTASLG